LEISYKSKRLSSQYGALHLNDSYIRLIYGPTSGWGTSIILLPVFWSRGQLYQGARISSSTRVERACLLLNLNGEIAGMRVSTQVRISPPEQDSITAAVTTRVKGKIQLDSRSAEAFKLVMLSSMHRSTTEWDAQTAGAGGHAYEIPEKGWIIQPPVVADQFNLQGGTSEWKINAPSVVIELDRQAQITGWVTPTDDPNDDNVGFWAAAEELLKSWSYNIRVMRKDNG